MKNKLQKQNEKRELRLATTSGLFATDSDNNGHLCKKEFMPWFILPILFLIISITSLKAQTAYNINDFSSSIDAATAQQLENLLDVKNTTLFINKNNSKVKGDLSPTIVDVTSESIKKLYTANKDYEKIEVIRIILRKPSDLNNQLDMENLSHFKNLKYIFILATFEICDNNANKGNCRKTKINNMISFIEGDNVPIVLFKVSLPS
jgi:hypothetical protein